MAVWVATLNATGGDARLLEAVKAGDAGVVRALLKARVSVSVREADGTTPLHWAVRADDTETAQLLIHAGADVKAVNRYGVTPLSLAAINGNARLVDVLLKAGADPNASLTEGETVLMTAARTGNAAVVRALLARGADVDAREKGFGETALMWAAAESHAAAVDALVEYGADINARSTVQEIPTLYYPRTGFDKTNLPRGGWTPLMYAARQGAVDAARSLVNAGADVNLSDPDGTTALVFAIINAHDETAALLLDHRADPNIGDHNGTAALYAAVDMRRLPWVMGRPDPQLSSEQESLGLLTAILDHGANPNAPLSAPTLRRQHTDGDPILGAGATPFMRAAKAGDVEAMRVLVAHGADPLRTEKNHTTALMIAAGMGWRDLDDVRDRGSDADLIRTLDYCLSLGFDVNAANDAGDTALHAAAGKPSDDIVRFLIKKGARLDAKNTQGRTPRDVALRIRGGKGKQTAALLGQLTDGAAASGVAAPSE